MENRIRELREARGINQSELAQILGVRQNTLSTWETGRYEPDGEMLKKIAAALNVSVDYLLGGDPPWTTYTGDQFNYLDMIKIMRTLEQLTAAQFKQVYLPRQNLCGRSRRGAAARFSRCAGAPSEGCAHHAGPG